VDVALDCSGDETAQIQCLDAAAGGGRVAFVGIKSETTPVAVLRHLIVKELTLIGSWYSSPSEHPEMMALIERGLPAERMITHRFSLEDAPEAFRAFFAGETVKVILDPWR
jgi:propanol-preferring alcohol dehydrogenase